jgi:hypothetical protein
MLDGVKLTYKGSAAVKRSPHEFQRHTRLSSWDVEVEAAAGADAEADDEVVVAEVEAAGVLPLELELDDWALESCDVCVVAFVAVTILKSGLASDSMV